MMSNVGLLMDAEALATELGVAVRTIRTWDYAGRIPRPIQIGTRIRWRRTEIEAWIEAGTPTRDVWEVAR